MEKKIIVPARIADTVLLKNIDDVSFNKEFHEDISYYEDCFKNGYDCYLLMVDSLPAGELILRFDEEDTLGLESFAIVPQYRGRGYSKFLLDFVDAYAKQNFKRIVLEVSTDNKKAIDIYKKQGYNISHTIMDFYKFGMNAYVMEKIL